MKVSIRPRRMMNARGFGDYLCHTYLAAMKENK